MSERYANKRQLFRSSGRFAKPPTLEQMGVPLADGEYTCGDCNFVWHPVVKDCICPRCESKNVTPNAKACEAGMPAAYSARSEVHVDAQRQR